MFPRLQHHPQPEGALPHVADGGAAADAGGAAGGGLGALHHHQALRLLPVRHQRHHVTHASDAFRASWEMRASGESTAKRAKSKASCEVTRRFFDVLSGVRRRLILIPAEMKFS